MPVAIPLYYPVPVSADESLALAHWRQWTSCRWPFLVSYFSVPALAPVPTIRYSEKLIESII
jgi:hypothetical protein